MTRSILLSGASGFIGSYLSKFLLSHGYEVIPLSRSPEGAEISYEEIGRRSYYAVINLSGENIFSLWTPKKKREIWNSRINSTKKIVDELKEDPPKIFLSASAVGYYGDRGDERLTEDSKKGEGFLSDLCEKWEKSAAELDLSLVTHLRFGMVLDRSGGAFSKLLPSIKLGLGTVVGSGKQYISWISLHDLSRSIMFLLENPVKGAVNITTPHFLTQRSFIKELAKFFNRPSFLRVPSFLFRLLPGDMGKEVFLTSVACSPERLKEAGFVFHHSTIGEFLESLES